MDVVYTLNTAAQQLRLLFADKGELRGVQDWDTFLGSIMLIETAAAQLKQMAQEKETEE